MFANDVYVEIMFMFSLSFKVFDLFCQEFQEDGFKVFVLFVVWFNQLELWSLKEDELGFVTENICLIGSQSKVLKT